jgi:hypothetical protein
MAAPAINDNTKVTRIAATTAVPDVPRWSRKVLPTTEMTAGKNAELMLLPEIPGVTKLDNPDPKEVAKTELKLGLLLGTGAPDTVTRGGT